MKMIIDINPEMKDWIVNGFPDEEDMPRILRVIKHATPLEECEDCISRQAVLDLPRIKTHNQWGNVIKESVDVEDVRQLPPVTPAEKVGRWEKVTVENKDGSISWLYACSECGSPCPKTDYGTDYFGGYCSECGAKMEEVEE